MSDLGWTPPDLATVLARWDLVADGPAVPTPSSTLQPVLHRGIPAMVKVARVDEERDGARLMVWWAGRGAARVLLHDDDALLLERATGPRSLIAWATSGEAGDDEATRVLCSLAGELHAVGRSGVPPVGLVPLERWFADLLDGPGGTPARTTVPGTGATGGGDPEVAAFLRRAAGTARALLDDQHEVVVLHGDLHHANVLDFGDASAPRWRVIDPKSLRGDRAFDHANILCNPSPGVATAPGRLARQVAVIAATAGIERRRMLRWVVAWTALSATWHLAAPTAEGGAFASAVLAVGQEAERLLG